MLNWTDVQQNFVNGLFWGIGFAIPLFIMMPWAIMRILSHPTLRNLAKAAAKATDGSGGGFLSLLEKGWNMMNRGK